MEASQWVIAMSTMVIAFVFLMIAVFLIRAFLILKKDTNLLSESVEKKIQALDNSWRYMLGLPPSDADPLTKAPPRKLPLLLRSALFAATLWKNIQKRR
ncbi:MAG TPA: hypothetical protein VGM34_01700 [Chlamydiales bacterium]|jgi:hypothetical protein